MTKALVQITIDVEYEQVHSDNDQHLKNIIVNLNDQVHQAVGRGMLSPPTDDECELTTWDISVKVIDPEKTKAQFHAERNTQTSQVTAYFSSDGPAVAIEVPGVEPEPGQTLLISDINGALREAFHKYRAHLRED